MKMVHISEHQDTVIVDKVETVMSILDVASFEIVVPLLVRVVSNEFLHITMDSWIVYEVIVMHPGLIFASEHKVLRGCLSL